ncbi:MAG: nickel-dependent lactate racemase, partial [Kiritimatiellae bacterium]|nr:nickel-dependent lactate racemase [Kiritimatiellia bacterium]
DRALAAVDIEDALHTSRWFRDGTSNAYELVHRGESVCLVVSDHTRKTAVDRVLPVLVRGLVERGCRIEDMFVLVATGIHRAPTAMELRTILGGPMADCFAGRIFVHDCDDASNLIHVGTTRRGHAVRLNRRAVEADRLILLGAATYHYHAGFGGGRKSLVPGLASRDTIAYNHSLTLDTQVDRIHPNVEIGRLDGNPVAEEMLEAARFVPPDFIINTVLDGDGQLVGCFAGDMELAHSAACRMVERVCRCDIVCPADVVIASAEGASNWIQAHKALYNASRAVTADGRVVLLAECPEGLGDERLRYWLRRPTLADLYSELRRSVEVNGQTVLSTRIRGTRTILVTGMSQQDIRDLGIATAPGLASAIQKALAEVGAGAGRKPTCYLMPRALDTVPFVRGGACG